LYRNKDCTNFGFFGKNVKQALDRKGVKRMSLRERLAALQKAAENPNALGLDKSEAKEYTAGEDNAMDHDTTPDTELDPVAADDSAMYPDEDSDKTGMHHPANLMDKNSSTGGDLVDPRKKEAALHKKADVCIKIAEMMLPNGNGEAIRNQATDLMEVPNHVLASTAQRLVYSRQGFKLAHAMKKRAAQKLEDEKKAAENEKRAAEEELDKETSELDDVASILKLAEVPTEEYEEVTEEVMPEEETVAVEAPMPDELPPVPEEVPEEVVEAAPEVMPEEVTEETEIDEISAMLDDFEEARQPRAEITASKEEKLDRVKKAAVDPASTQEKEMDLISTAFMDEEDVDVSAYFK